MKILSAVTVKCYKTIYNQSVELLDFNTFVGANETGKSNLLSAINHISSLERKNNFTTAEFKRDSDNWPDDEIRITYQVIITDKTTPLLLKQFPQILNHKINITKAGSCQKPFGWFYSNPENSSYFPEIIEVLNKEKFFEAFSGSLPESEKQLIEKRGWLYKSGISFGHNPYKQLKQDGFIKLMEDSKRDEIFLLELGAEVKTNLNIVYWSYKEENFISSRVNIDEFIAAPDNFSALDNIFSVAGIGREKYQFLKSNPIDLGNGLIDSANAAITDLIKTHWKTNKNVELKMQISENFIDINFTDSSMTLPPNLRSDGFKWFISFLIYFKSRVSKLEGAILLIDEPGSTLHPGGQKDVLAELIRLSINNQLIYTTHQTFMIDKNNPKSIQLLTRNKLVKRKGKDCFDTNIERISNNTKYILKDKLLREALGFTLADVSTISDKNILVEGVFDKEVLTKVAQKIGAIDLNETSIVDAGRASNIPHLAQYLASNNLEVVCLFDSDDAGKSGYNKAKNNKKITPFKITEFTTDTAETIEDILPLKTLERGREKLFQDLGKQVPTAAIKKPIIKEMKGVLEEDPNTDRKRMFENILAEIISEDVEIMTDENFDTEYSTIIKIAKKLGEKLGD